MDTPTDKAYAILLSKVAEVKEALEFLHDVPNFMFYDKHTRPSTRKAMEQEYGDYLGRRSKDKKPSALKGTLLTGAAGAGIGGGIGGLAGTIGRVGRRGTLAAAGLGALGAGTGFGLLGLGIAQGRKKEIDLSRKLSKDTKARKAKFEEMFPGTGKVTHTRSRSFKGKPIHEVQVR